MTRILIVARILWLELLRKKDVYVLLILLGALLVTLVSLDIFGLGGVVGYLKDVGLLMAWLFGWVLAINVSSRALPEEERRGTIFPLLAKPVTRFEIVIGKWLGSWSVVAGATLLFYLLVAGVVLLSLPADASARVALNPAAFLQGFVLHAAALAILTAVGVAFSTRMNHDAAATTSYVLSAAAFLVVPRVPEFLVKEHGFSASVLMGLYHLMPHFELFDMRKRIVHDFGPAPVTTFCLVLAYGALLTSILLLIAWIAYRQKRFSRGSLAQ